MWAFQAEQTRAPASGARRISAAVGAVGFGPLVGGTVDVESARPRLVVDLGAGAHLTGPVAEPLHALLGRGREQLAFRARFGFGRAGDLGDLRLGEVAAPERLVGRGQLVEGASGIQRRDAAPTVVPAAAATKCAALRCPSSRHTLVSSTRRAAPAP